MISEHLFCLCNLGVKSILNGCNVVEEKLSIIPSNYLFNNLGEGRLSQQDHMRGCSVTNKHNVSLSFKLTSQS